MAGGAFDRRATGSQRSGSVQLIINLTSVCPPPKGRPCPHTERERERQRQRQRDGQWMTSHGTRWAHGASSRVTEADAAFWRAYFIALPPCLIRQGITIGKSASQPASNTRPSQLVEAARACPHPRRQLCHARAEGVLPFWGAERGGGFGCGWHRTKCLPVPSFWGGFSGASSHLLGILVSAFGAIR